MDRQSLSNHLKQLRLAKNMTLHSLEQICGVSKATLSRIEKSEASPTAETLAKLAAAYQLPISALLQPYEQTFENKICAESQSVWQDVENGFTRTMISPPSSALAIELVQGELLANQSIHYKKPTFIGQEHHLWVLSGRLSIRVNGSDYELTQGDCLRYKLNAESCFSTGDIGARYVIALSNKKE